MEDSTIAERNVLSTVTNDVPSIINAHNIVEEDEALKQIEKIKSLLKTMDMLEQKRRELVELEYETLNQVDLFDSKIDKDGFKRLDEVYDKSSYLHFYRSKHKATFELLEWWLNKTDSERKRTRVSAVSYCSTIRGEYQREKKEAKAGVAANKSQIARDSANYAYDKQGQVELDCYDWGSKSPTISIERKISDAMKNRTRNDLQRKGAVCVGDNVYVNPRRFPKEALPALDIQAKQILVSIESFRNLFNALNNCGITYKEDSIGENTRRLRKLLANAGEWSFKYENGRWVNSRKRKFITAVYQEQSTK